MQIRGVAATLAASSDDRSPAENDLRARRSAALEAVAAEYDRIEAAFALRAPGVTSSLGADAAYTELSTRDLWEGFFVTFFEGPESSANSAHVVERIFVRMRGFEVD